MVQPSVLQWLEKFSHLFYNYWIGWHINSIQQDLLKDKLQNTIERFSTVKRCTSYSSWNLFCHTTKLFKDKTLIFDKDNTNAQSLRILSTVVVCKGFYAYRNRLPDMHIGVATAIIRRFSNNSLSMPFSNTKPSMSVKSILK